MSEEVAAEMVSGGAEAREVLAGMAAEGAEGLRGRHLLRLADLTPEEVLVVVATAAWWKARRGQPGLPRPLEGKTLGMIFAKPSTRTRVSFQAAVARLGGQALPLGAGDLQLGRGETVADTARVLSRYLDGILIRTFAQAEVEELAAHATVPVINGLTDAVHPTQALADLLTIHERFGRWRGLKLAYVGDGNNMAHSLMMAAAKVGMDFAAATPPGYEPDAAEVAAARAQAVLTGGGVSVGHDAREAVRGAHVVYTDVWTSMGQEAEREERLRAFQPYQVDAALMAAAAPDAVFLHCLPAHRGEEVAAEVIDGPRSLVFDQAENRLHVFQALLTLLLP